MHIRHRCRNGPRLIKGLSAFPAEVPMGYLFGCFTSHCLEQGFETCPLINEHPIRARPLSFVLSLLDCTALLETMLVASSSGIVKRDSVQWKPVWNCIALIFIEWKKAVGVGRWVSWYRSRFIFKETFFFSGVRLPLFLKQSAVCLVMCLLQFVTTCPVWQLKLCLTGAAVKASPHNLAIFHVRAKLFLVLLQYCLENCVEITACSAVCTFCWTNFTVEYQI